MTAQERIAALRKKFLEQLPERLERIKVLSTQLSTTAAAAPVLDELHRLVHNIKGTGRSFGFSDLGDVAGQVEDLVCSLLDSGASAPTTDCHQLFGQSVQVLGLHIAALCTTESASEYTEHEALLLPETCIAPLSPKETCLVYLCEDDELLLQQLSIQLGCFGYEIHTFLSTEALREAVRERWPDVVLMDIEFPEGRSAGTSIAQAIRQEMGKPLPAVFMSSHDDIQSRLNAVLAGGEAYFHKPVNVMDLVRVMDELSNRSQPEPYRVLIVDDEPGVATYHAILLQEAGMLTAQLTDPAQLRNALDDFRPDIVLMDIYMPGCNGRDLAKLIRQLPDYVGLPIVYLSSETDRQKLFSAMQVGVEGFLCKPVVPQELVAAVSVRADRMRILRSRMVRDSLTGLLNHTAITQFLENVLANTERQQAELCFTMIDIDAFKQVNDTYGHPVGDQVLLALSRLMQQRLRGSDIVGRYGGEEFAIILAGASPAMAWDIIDELRRNFELFKFKTPQGTFSCTFSAGIASCTRHTTLTALREAADKTLYRAKHNGRNQVLIEEDAP